MPDARGYEWGDDVDAIEEIAQRLAAEHNYYQPYHRGLLCISANKIRAEAREIWLKEEST